MTKRLIGICGVRIFEQNVMPFIQMLKREAEQNGFQLISFIGSTNNQEETDEIIGQYQLVELAEYVDMCALVILSETILNERMIQKLVDLGKKKNIPVFSLDRKVEGCYNLLFDNEKCFEQIVRHVVEDHGCRHVNMISGDKGHFFSEERIAVYRKVLEENGIPFEEERIGYGNYWERPVAEVVQRFLDSRLPFPEAIVCANDIMAHAAISVLNEHGYEVPEDIIVTGYDGTKNGNIFIPSLTTGTPDYEKMIAFIMGKIMQYSEDNMTAPVDMVVPVHMKNRQSCGCEPKIVPKNDRRVSRLLNEIGNGKWHMKAMRLMLSDSADKLKIEEVFPIIQKHMDIYFDYYRQICIKSELLRTYDAAEQCADVTNVLEADFGEFKETGTSWNLSEFQSRIDTIRNMEKVSVILVHLLNSGKDVYGFTVEGYDELVDWQLKHGDEFAMFVSHILQVVIHNFKMNEMNKNLQKVNQEIEELSLRDPMTTIYNRRGFFHNLQKIIQMTENQGKYLYLFFIDMDGLKFINDNFGHKEGDFAIGTLAKVLSTIGKGEKVCARIGGDEFICAFVEDKVQDYTSAMFRGQLEELIGKAEGVAEKSYPVSASVGMITEIISDSLDLDAMINQADDKMYQQKMARKNSLRKSL